MKRITTIISFSVPEENRDEFLTNWQRIKEIMQAQPGALDTVMHRSIDDDAAFQFVNVAHWESPEAMTNALKASAEQREREGVNMPEMMQRLGVRMSKNNYVEEL